jgi:hypothetical protein
VEEAATKEAEAEAVVALMIPSYSTARHFEESQNSRIWNLN